MTPPDTNTFRIEYRVRISHVSTLQRDTITMIELHEKGQMLQHKTLVRITFPESDVTKTTLAQ